MDDNNEHIENGEPLRMAAQALRNNYRQKIFSLLSSRNNLSFNELMKSLDISRPKLAYHLKILMNNNIITNFYDKRDGMKDHSFYELSAFGQDIVIGGTLSSNKRTQDNEFEPPDYDLKKRVSANFRTVIHPKYRAYDNIPIQISKNNIKPIQREDQEYFDPFLKYNIINKARVKKTEKRVLLPTSKQYYLLYKKPFKAVGNLKIKY